MYEPAHVVVSAELGWTLRYARISAGGESGEIADRPPHDADPCPVAVQSAVISLDGPRASARQRWLLPCGCRRDGRDARRTLRGTGVGYGQARRDAGRRVDRQWAQTQRTARRRYHDGAL